MEFGQDRSVRFGYISAKVGRVWSSSAPLLSESKQVVVETPNSARHVPYPTNVGQHRGSGRRRRALPRGFQVDERFVGRLSPDKVARGSSAENQRVIRRSRDSRDLPGSYKWRPPCFCLHRVRPHVLVARPAIQTRRAGSSMAKK